MRMFNTKYIFISFIALILLGIAATPFSALAAPQASAGFHVRASIPNNQLDKRVSYFDLRMQPEQTQTLEVEVTNELDIPLSISVEAISASTNKNGIIDYKTPDIRDKTLKIPFSSIATVESETLHIPAKATVTAAITVTMPKKVFDGIILGGLNFTRIEKSPINPDKETTINNVFSYVIGVKLSETDVEVLPDFEIAEIAPQTVFYQPAFVHGIRNKAAAIAKDIDINILISDSTGAIKAKFNQSNIDMAPNSVMPLGVTPEQQTLEAGEYLSDITITYNNKDFHYQMNFTVDDTEANQVNNEIIQEAEPQAEELNFMPALFLLIISVLLFLIILLLFLLKRKTKEETDDNTSQIM